MIMMHSDKAEKIHSVRKDKRLKEHLERRGFFKNLDKIRFKVNENDSGIERYEKLKKAVSRFAKKELSALKVEEINAFLAEEIKGEHGNIQIKLLDDLNENHVTRLRFDIIKEYVKKEYALDESIQNEFAPVQLISIGEDGEEKILGYTLLNKTIPKTKHSHSYYPKRESYIHSVYYRRYVQQEEYKKTYCCVTLYDFTTIVTDIYLKNMLHRFLRNNLEIIRYNLVKESIKHQVKRIYTEPSVILKDEHGVPYYEHETIEYLECCVPSDEEYQKEFLVYLRKHFPEVKEINPLHSMNRTKGVFYGNELPFNDEKKDSVFLISAGVQEMNDAFYIELTKQLERIRYDVEEEEEIEKSDYAKSFQTKRHINKETQKVMEQNEFLSHYGYVELDNDVDLKKFKEVEKDFIDVRENFFVPLDKTHSFRIKKLGKHKANGLYVPMFRATIVDLDGISSFIHEVGHQIDYLYAQEGYRLSELVAFRKIVERSQEVANTFVQTLDENDEFRVKWEKGQKDYYNNPKEIFARSYELYAHTKGFSVSLAKTLPKNSFLYPMEEGHISAVKDYFDNLLIELKKA